MQALTSIEAKVFTGLKSQTLWNPGSFSEDLATLVEVLGTQLLSLSTLPLPLVAVTSLVDLTASLSSPLIPAEKVEK